MYSGTILIRLALTLPHVHSYLSCSPKPGSEWSDFEPMTLQISEVISVHVNDFKVQGHATSYSMGEYSRVSATKTRIPRALSIKRPQEICAREQIPTASKGHAPPDLMERLYMYLWFTIYRTKHIKLGSKLAIKQIH